MAPRPNDAADDAMTPPSYLGEVQALFDGAASVDYFSDGDARVWVRNGQWHVHNGASSGDPCGAGKTVEDAAQRLLEYIRKPGSVVARGRCSHECYRAYSQSIAATIAAEEFRKLVYSCGQNRKSKAMPKTEPTIEPKRDHRVLHETNKLRIIAPQAEISRSNGKLYINGDLVVEVPAADTLGAFYWRTIGKVLRPMPSSDELTRAIYEFLIGDAELGNR